MGQPLLVRAGPLTRVHRLALPFKVAIDLTMTPHRVVTEGKFGDEPGGWCSLVGKKGYGVGLWKALRGGWEAFKARTIFIVGNRRRTKFWLDVLYEDAPLKDSFPFLFSFASNKKAWVGLLRRLHVLGKSSEDDNLVDLEEYQEWEVLR
ncbi:hypothetical protein CK203_010391 [Vitis vinifera]|uniref:Uncharacterized protein n=1 Tax=Vitis vinifera TaxID=29760 RepID=A0A438JXT7_VITVI|nr:hypothetical protein CK203_010391 [Vitis vinifera]